MGVSLKDSFQCRSPRDICSRPSDGGGAPLTERRDCNHGLTSRLARLYRNLYVTKLFPAVTQCPIEVPSMSTLYCCITRALKSLTLHVNGLRNQHCSTLHVGYLRFRTVQKNNSCTQINLFQEWEINCYKFIKLLHLGYLNLYLRMRMRILFLARFRKQWVSKRQV